MTVKEHLELCSVANKEISLSLHKCRIECREFKLDSETWKKRALEKRDEVEELQKRWFFDFSTMRTRGRILHDTHD